MVPIEHPFPVVGIGASAGGLEALQHFLRLLPADPGLAFIIVTHRARGHEDALAEILQRSTAMPVVNASENIQLEPNHIYVCPADMILTVDGRHLRARLRQSDSQRKPIDVFLGSLAEQLGEASVGILLSGAGSDGALGLKAIKERHGFTLAQTADGSGPKQSGMPDTAIAAGVVDLAVPVEEMPGRLVEYAKNFARIESLAREEGLNGQKKMYREIYRILLNQVGHDFSGYKEKTFSRRVLRRMQVCQLTELEAYVARLRESSDEVTALFRDLLIGVTNFFRDPDAFLALEEQIIPQLFKDKHANDTIRIWVPGCATGEEVYSIAILVKEHLEGVKHQPKVQIFATDIDEPALVVARAARYPGSLMDGVSPERIRKFFDADDVSFAVKKEVREICIFSPHSILRDPPFSRMDLISCRNLLIYLGTEFQGQVVPVFHFALRPKGFLFLGTSENIGHHAQLFSPVDKESRIFQRRDHAVSQLHNSLFAPGSRPPSGARENRRGIGGSIIDLRRSAETRILEQFSPAHVVVNAEGDILHYSPRTGKYLEAPVGQPSRQLLPMARRGLRLELRSALKEAAESRRRVHRENLVLELEDRAQTINLTVEPFGDLDSGPLFLVIFQDAGEPTHAGPIQAPDQAVNASFVERRSCATPRSGCRGLSKNTRRRSKS